MPLLTEEPGGKLRGFSRAAVGDLKGTGDEIDAKGVGDEGTASCPEMTLCI